MQKEIKKREADILKQQLLLDQISQSKDRVEALEKELADRQAELEKSYRQIEQMEVQVQMWDGQVQQQQ